jgi:uncharacterized protein (TIGR02145 family)
MKTFLTLSLHLLISSFLWAQAPQGIPYQAVMRNADGSVMANSAVNLTFMIHDGSATGTVVYQESHALTSNAQGLVSCVVGNGVVSQGNFSNINWGSGTKFLHVMMGTTDLGTQQMLSVPFALYAEDVSVRVSITGDSLFIGDQISIVPGVSAANPPSLYTQGTGVTDIDGNFYPSIIINGQEWMQKNLAVSKYRNGDPIPTGLDDATWSVTTSGAYAIYNNEIANNTLYGKLYNWYAVNDSRGLCPTGWHVPSDAEWNIFIANLGGDEVAGGKMKSITGWNSPNTGGTNESGFTGLAGGERKAYVSFVNMGNAGDWWSGTDFFEYNLNNSTFPWFIELYSYDSVVNVLNLAKNNGLSVRCLKDSETPPIQGCTDGAACNFLANANQDDGSCLYLNATCDDGNANTINDVINGSCDCAGTAVGNGIYTQGNGVTDIDGNTYTSIIINGQEWMQQNLAVSKYGNGDAIPTGLSNVTWQSTTIGAYAVYNNDAFNNTLYGKLYNWHAVNDSRGLCPTGWHVPSDAEWNSVINFLDPSADGGNNVNNAGGKMKATNVWNSPNAGATNESGFIGLPGGYRFYDGTNFDSIGNYGFWWSGEEYVSNFARGRRLSYDGFIVDRTTNNKQNGFSVRCVRD